MNRSNDLVCRCKNDNLSILHKAKTSYDLAENYSSLCIANLGVVPLFSFAFFLFLPALFCLFFLILLVLRVLEPILESLLNFIEISFREITFIFPIVKIFIIISTLSNYQAHSETQRREVLAEKEIFLSIGEQTSFKVTALDSFSVGNKSVIKAKYFHKNKEILIKGSSIGVSDILIYSNNKKTKLIVFVSSKKNKLKSFSAARAIRKLGLSSSAHSSGLIVKGKLMTLEDYRLYLELTKKEKIIGLVKLARSLKSKLLEKIYIRFNPFVEHIYCHFIDVRLHCEIKTQRNIDHIIRNYKKNYAISFDILKYYNSIQNFNIKLDIIKLERNLSKGSSLGLDKLEANIGELLNTSSESLIRENGVFYKEYNTLAKLVASPQIILALNDKGKIELGSEIPFSQTSQVGTQTNWKFAGLRVNINLKEVSSKLQIHLRSQLTAPEEARIGGSKVNQSFFIKTPVKRQIFKLKYRGSVNKESSLPLFNNIAFLRKLFSAQEFQNSEVTLIGHITIKKESL